MDSKSNIINKNIKDFLKIIFMLLIVLIVYIFRKDITYFIMEKIVYKSSNQVLSYNEYYQDYNYEFVQNIDTNKVKNYQELLNVIYTTINSGDDAYTFFCDYKECKDDVKKIISDGNDTITDINNFVHPYNSIPFLALM